MHRKVFAFWLIAGFSAVLWTGFIHAADQRQDDGIRYLCIGEMSIDLSHGLATEPVETGQVRSAEFSRQLCAMAGLDLALPGEMLLGAKTASEAGGVFVSRVKGTTEQALATADDSLRIAGWKGGNSGASGDSDFSRSKLRMFTSLNARMFLMAVSTGISSSVLVATIEVKRAQ